MSLIHPFSFAIGLSLAAACMIALRLRGRPVLLASIATLLLAIAAGGPMMRRHPPIGATVMIDLSPSTRGALFRHRSTLRHRVRELLGSMPIRWAKFADGNRTLNIDAASDVIADQPCDETRFDPPDDRPVLLFSDGNFSTASHLNSAVYPVIDPLLSQVDDSAIEQLSATSSSVVATVRSNTRNMVQWTGVTVGTSVVPAGRSIISGDRPTSAQIAARIAGHDRWPENDSLSTIVAPTNSVERWWVGDEPAPAGWRTMQPDALPTDSSEWLGVSLVVLANVPANAIDANRQDALRGYVHDLGGGLLITGGDHAFGAGRYEGSMLQSLSPLSADPPTATRRWLLLVDRSGSMSADSAGQSRLQRAVDAAIRLIPALPPADRLRLGDFADSLHWWNGETSAREAAHAAAPVLEPHGPTNLQSALRQIAADADDTLPTDVVLLTDADTTIDQPDALSGQLAARHVRVDLLAITDTAPASDVTRIVQQTGGRTLISSDPRQWASDLRTLANFIDAEPVNHQPAEVHYLADAQLPNRTVSPWIATWAQAGAIALTRGDPRAARWSIGLGAVGAMSFRPDEAELAAFENWLEIPAADPDLRVDWNDHSPVTITIDATHGNAFRNDLQLSLTIGDRQSVIVPLVGPGRYRARIASPAWPTVAVLLDGKRIVDRHVLAGRYPQEFDRIGNNVPALQELADATGGKLIPPSQRTPIHFHWPAKETSLTTLFAIAGALVLGAACLFRRI